MPTIQCFERFSGYGQFNVASTWMGFPFNTRFDKVITHHNTLEDSTKPAPTAMYIGCVRFGRSRVLSAYTSVILLSCSLQVEEREHDAYSAQSERSHSVHRKLNIAGNK